MPAPSVTALPTAPQRTMTPEAFIDASDPWAAALGPWGEQVEAVGDYVEETAAAVTSSAAAAATSATSSASSATASAESATSAASSATTATTKASEAATSATAAETARAASVVAKTAAETAQAAAEAARDEAEAIVGDGYVLKPGGTGNTGKVAVFSDTDGRNVTGLAIGAAASTDIIDRQTGDARYALSGSGASSRDLARHALAIAELRGTRLPGRAGWADAFGDTTGVDASASSNEIYDGTADSYSNSNLALDTWTSRTSNSPSHLTTIAYGAGLFVAVGYSGGIVSSPDGVTWTNRTVSTWASYTLQGITFAAGLFVAVGNFGLLLTSPDGINWTARTSGIGGDINGVAYGAGVFVYVGAGGELRTSTDGMTWTARTSGVSQLTRVFFDNGLFVAVGLSGTILTSPDGVTWTARTSGTSEALGAISYGAGLYAVGGNAGTILTSPDGVTWTARTSGTAQTVRAIFYGAGVFVVGLADGNIRTSTDGIAWTARTSGSSSATWAVIWAIDLFVVLQQGGTIITSPGTLAAMDLRSVAGSLPAVPSTASLAVIAKGASAITPGTHLTGYVSRDDGANWQDMSLVAAETDSAGWTVFEAYGVSLASQPSGDDLRWRVTTTDDFAVEVAGVFVGVEV